MAALLVALSVMAVMLSIALPAWKQQGQREKESELVFRGQQYARAIGLFQRRHGPGTLPPTLDVLLEERSLRRKYKDPITKDDFEVLRQGQVAITAPGQTAGGAAGRGVAPQVTGRGATPTPSSNTPSGGVTGGIIGVASKSKAASIRIYNGRTHYNEWAFIYQPPVQPGAGGGGVPGVPGAGGRGGPPGGRGAVPIAPPGGPGMGRGAEPGGRGVGPGRGSIGSPPTGPFVPAPTRRP